MDYILDINMIKVFEKAFDLPVAIENDEYMLGLQGSSVTLTKTIAKMKQLPEGSITGEKVFSLLEEGDRMVQSVFQTYCRNIVTQIINL